jgi:hypothetical protein
VASEVGSGSIVGLIHRFRERASGRTGLAEPLVRARQRDSLAWRRLVAEIEWKLVDMPLAKLQRIGGEDMHWLYDLGFDDRARKPLKTSVTAWLYGGSSDFDNAIRLLPGVPEALVRLAPMLRAFIQQQWTARVAHLNGLEGARLGDFLFGVAREDLSEVRMPLVDLQEGRCFYCGGTLRGEQAQIDHFLPWARLPENGLANLVAADARCNGEKRDFLADDGLLARWRHRLDQAGPHLDAMAAALRWELATDRCLAGARSLYLPLPSETRLWSGRQAWITMDRAVASRIRGVLSA